jgi:predicted Zn-dependent peptidase
MAEQTGEAAAFPTHRLANGLQIVGQPMAGVQSAALGFMVIAGSRDETAADSGIAHFVESIAFQGTQHRDARSLTEAWEEIGARYGASAGTEYSWYSAQVLGRNLEPALELLADVLCWPGFPEDEVPKVQSRLVQEIAQMEDQPMSLVGELMARTYFADHPLGNSVHGTRESIAAIDVPALQRFWSRQYAPNRTILAVAGRIDFDAVVGKAERLLGDWPAGEPEPTLPPFAPAKRLATMARESNQQHIALAAPAVTVNDPEYYTGLIMGDILGGGMNSRLFEEVREKRGLAYGVGASVNALKSTGLLRVYCGTTPEKAHESVKVIAAELRRLADEGVTEDELRLAQTSLKSSIVMRNESAGARRTVIGTQWWMRGAVRTLEETRREIEAVTVERVNALARRLAPADNLTLVTIGPRAAEELMNHGE